MFKKRRMRKASDEAVAKRALRIKEAIRTAYFPTIPKSALWKLRIVSSTTTHQPHCYSQYPHYGGCDCDSSTTESTEEFEYGNDSASSES